MLEHLPEEIREGLARAHRRQSTNRRRLALHIGEQVFPIHKFWPEGFAISSEGLSGLRGHVDIYEGSRHILTCLIIASDFEGEQLICHFKRATRVHDAPPLDYEVDSTRATLFLSQH